MGKYKYTHIIEGGKDYLKIGRRRQEDSWTQSWGSSETESELLPLLTRSSEERPPSSSTEGKPNGRVRWIWAWCSASPNNAPAAYFCVGVKIDDDDDILSYFSPNSNYFEWIYYQVTCGLPLLTPENRNWNWNWATVIRFLVDGFLIFSIKFKTLLIQIGLGRRKMSVIQSNAIFRLTISPLAVWKKYCRISPQLLKLRKLITYIFILFSV